VWLEKMEGGIEHLKEVVINDKLGICDKLEADMQHLVDTYECEWAAVVKDPEKRAKFRHFAGSTEQDETVEFVPERGQVRPKDWPNTCAPMPIIPKTAPRSWVKVAQASEFPKDGGRAIKHGQMQIAVFNFSSRGEWYATQNRCPHMGDAVLARGIIGDEKGTPKVACPLHKKTFALDDGRCLTGDADAVETYAVEIKDGWVHVELPAVDADQLVAPHRLVRRPEAELRSAPSN
jgi:nitrite reductase (NADH) large subunit